MEPQLRNLNDEYGKLDQMRRQLHTMIEAHRLYRATAKGEPKADLPF